MTHRVLRQTSARRSRSGASAVSSAPFLDGLEICVVEIESKSELEQVVFTKYDGNFRVKSSTLPRLKPGDYLVRIRDVDIVHMDGGVSELLALIESSDKWPVMIETRTGAQLPIGALRDSTTIKSALIPQIPSAIDRSISGLTNPSVIIDEGEIDLTVSDSEDADLQQEQPTLSTAIRAVSGFSNASDMAATWHRGSIVRTRFGVGSVLQCSATKLVVALHWGGVEGDPKQHPIAYLNREDQLVEDADTETVFHEGPFVLTRSDYARFQRGMYLNDVIIDLFLNRFFFSKLESDGFQAVEKWTQKSDLFEKDYIIIPVNEARHWSLAVVCFPKRIFAATAPDSKADADDSVTFVPHVGISPENSAPDAQKNAADNIDGLDESESAKNDREAEASVTQGSDDAKPSVDMKGIQSSSRTSAFHAVNGNQSSSSKEAQPEVRSDSEDKATDISSEGQKLSVNDVSVSVHKRQRTTSETSARTPSGPRSSSMNEESAVSTRTKRQVKPVIRLGSGPVVEQKMSASKVRSAKQAKVRSKTPSEAIEDSGEDGEDASPETAVILKLDSTKSHESKDVAKTLRNWLVQEAKSRGHSLPSPVLDSKSLPIVPPRVPLQDNSCDCGVFVVLFAERFLKEREQEHLNGKPLFNPTQAQVKRRRFGELFGSKWFPLSAVIEKRREMAECVRSKGNVRS